MERSPPAPPPPPKKPTNNKRKHTRGTSWYDRHRLTCLSNPAVWARVRCGWLRKECSTRRRSTPTPSLSGKSNRPSRCIPPTTPLPRAASTSVCTLLGKLRPKHSPCTDPKPTEMLRPRRCHDVVVAHPPSPAAHGRRAQVLGVPGRNREDGLRLRGSLSTYWSCPRGPRAPQLALCSSLTLPAT